MKRPAQSGFTLLELFFVVSLIGILAAILLPALAKTREKARLGVCFSNLHQFGVALHLYSLEHKGELPWSGGHNDARCFASLNAEYINNQGLYMCPSDPQYSPKTPITNTLQMESGSFRMSYEYVGAWVDEPITVDLESPVVKDPDIPLVWDIFSASKDLSSVSHVPAAGNILFIDGRVDYRRARDWHAANLPAPLKDLRFDELLLRDIPMEEFYRKR